MKTYPLHPNRSYSVTKEGDWFVIRHKGRVVSKARTLSRAETKARLELLIAS